MPHPCSSVFWGLWADFVSEALAGVAPGDALKMSESVYSTLCSMQRAIERATAVAPTRLPARIGGPSPWDPAAEQLLVTAGQSFLGGLGSDEWDGGDGHHTSHAVGWILTGSAEAGAVAQLRGGGGAVGGLLGKVRSALGS